MVVAIAAFFIGQFTLRFLGTRARPVPELQTGELSDGVIYEQVSAYDSVVHIAQIDLNADVEIVATPADSPGERRVYDARTTTEFTDEFDALLAVNASYYYPFEIQTYLSCYPGSGDDVAVLGHTISDGVEVSAYHLDETVPACFTSGAITFATDGRCPEGTENAVAGLGWLIRDGEINISFEHFANEIKYARSVLATDASGETLWLIIVDGRQEGYFSGMTVDELSSFLLDLGATDAINLDGGASRCDGNDHRRRG